MSSRAHWCLRRSRDNATAALSQTTSYAYDLGDRLTAITPPGQSATSFAFDALGRHTSRTGPGGTTTYAHVGTGEIAWQVTTGGVTTNAAIAPDESRLATSTGGTTGYLLPDLHGNTGAVVSTGLTSVLAALRYELFLPRNSRITFRLPLQCSWSQVGLQFPGQVHGRSSRVFGGHGDPSLFPVDTTGLGRCDI